MRSKRLSAFNIIQLIITVAAVLFGVYGFMTRGGPAANAPVVANVVDDNPSLDGGSVQSPTPLELPDFTPPPADVMTGPGPQSNKPVKSTPDDHGNAYIDGSVSFANGKPVVGVKVSAINTRIEPHAPSQGRLDPALSHKQLDDYYNSLERNTRIVTTDVTGHFRFAGLDPDDSYRLRINDPAVGASQKVMRPGSRADFQFAVVTTISGVVSCKGGKLPASYNVMVQHDTGRGWFNTTAQANFSDPAGKYKIRATAGKVKVVVSASGWIQHSAKVITVGDQGVTCDVTLVRAAILSGRVTSSDGSPMKGVTVTVVDGDAEALRPIRRRGLESNQRDSAKPHTTALFDAEPRADRVKQISDDLEQMKGAARRLLASGPRAYTDADGRYRIENLRPGSLTVIASYGAIQSKREITLNSGENFADFRLDTGCRVKVSARDRNGNDVRLTNAWFTAVNGKYQAASALPATKKGEREYIGLKEGDYIVNASAKGFPNARQRVTLRNGSNTVEIAFDAPATLYGQITTGGARIPAGLNVHLKSLDDPAVGHDKSWGRPGNYFPVDKDGNYRAENLKPGNYEFSVTFTGGDELYKQSIILSAGEQRQDARIDERCTLTVTVQLESGIKANAVYVSVARIDRKAGTQVARSGRLNDNGNCEFTFLPEGEYRVMAFGQGGSQQMTSVTLSLGSNSVSLKLGPPNCVRIASVAQGSQGAEAGLKEGDLIIEYNGSAIRGYEELVKAVRATSADDDVTIVVERGGATMSFRLKGGRIGISGTPYRR